MSRLSLTQLATLQAFVRTGTLAAAAESLGYTPGAVSQHVAALEKAYGARLVERSGRQLVLTDAGRVLAEYADRILAVEEEARHALASVEGRVAGPLTVGTWGSTAAGLLGPVVARMTASFPEVVVRSREVDLDQAAAAVRHQEVDVAFGLDYEDAPMPRDDALAVIALHEETFGIAVGARSPRGRSPKVDIATLAELDWILPPPNTQYGTALRSGFRRRGLEPRVIHEVTDTAASLQLAAAGLGATVVTDLMRRLNPNREIRRLEMADPLTRRIVLITPASVAFRQPIAAFTDVVKDAVRELLASPLP